MIYIVLFVVITFSLWFIISFILEKIKDSKSTKSHYLFLKNKYDANTKIILDLSKENETLKRENIEYKNMYNAICNEKSIIDIFRILDENNSPDITKQKLSKLWEVLPYYPPDWPIRKWVVKQRDCHTCRDCGKNLYYQKNGIGEVHHILPLSVGGTNEIKNLEFLCHECHKKKHREMFNYAFSRSEKFTLYEGWTYYNLFKNSWYFDKTAPKRLNEILALGTYEQDEPDTDKYYNISYWEDLDDRD